MTAETGLKCCANILVGKNLYAATHKCNRPAKYIWKYTNSGMEEPLCGLHVKRLKNCRELRKL